MPVRIYDISKKLGLENKEVLTKAKELGIAAARVASSSLDKITAEYLEQQLVIAYPDRAPAQAAAPAPVEQTPQEPILVVAAPPPPPAQAEERQEPETATATAVLEPEPPPVAEVPPVIAEPPPPPAAPVHFEEPVVAKAPPPPPPPPPVPAGPKVGDKVGFIQLPTKPGENCSRQIAGPAR